MSILIGFIILYFCLEIVCSFFKFAFSVVWTIIKLILVLIVIAAFSHHGVNYI